MCVVSEVAPGPLQGPHDIMLKSGDVFVASPHKIDGDSRTRCKRRLISLIPLNARGFILATVSNSM